MRHHLEQLLEEGDRAAGEGAREVIQRSRREEQEQEDEQEVLSEASTWTLELPCLADMQLCSSTELLGDQAQEQELEHDLKEQLELRGEAIQRLEQQLEVLEEQVRNYNTLQYIARMMTFWP